MEDLIASFILASIDFLKYLTIEFGILGLIIAMIIQSLVSPIPSEIILSIAGSAYISTYGFELGFLLAFTGSLIGSMIGAVICFYIGIYFEKWVIQRISSKEFELFSDLINKYGLWTIIIVRLIPFMPFDAVSYIAGIVKLKKSHFYIGTFIGLIPRITFYILLGSNVVALVESDFQAGLLLTVLIVLLLIILLYISRLLISRYYQKNYSIESKQDIIEQVRE